MMNDDEMIDELMVEVEKREEESKTSGFGHKTEIDYPAKARNFQTHTFLSSSRFSHHLEMLTDSIPISLP